MTIDEQVRSSIYHNDSVTFNYELNKKSAKGKLVKGSKRIPFEHEKNSASCNLIFSVGAWLTAVLPAVRYWEEIKGKKTCKVDDKVIKVIGIKSGKDTNGMCVTSQVVFYSNSDKVVLHLYNTTQRILVNGHGYENFVEIFLKPFFLSKVQAYPQEIQRINEEVSQKFGAKAMTKPSVKKKGRTSPSKSQTLLNTHSKNTHEVSFNEANIMTEPRQSTRNNYLNESLMIENMTDTDISFESQMSQITVAWIVTLSQQVSPI